MTAPAGHDIRLARSADVPAIESLVRDAYLPYVARIGQRPGPLDADYHQAVGRGSVWVLERADQIGGVIVLSRLADHLLIENVAVAAQLRGSGLGAELLHHAEQQARAHGLAEVRLYTHELMTENIAYYGRRGYRETGRHAHAGFDRVFFSKVLSGPDR